MKIKKVIASNVKGLEFEYDISPVTIVVGPNDSGKTAVPDAIRVALQGYKPDLGKQNQATMDLAGDQAVEMRCLVELDDQQKVWHNFKLKSDGGVDGTDKQEIANIEILDMAEFFNRERAEQLEFFLSKIDTSKIAFSDDDLIERLTELEALPAAEGVKGRDEMLAVVSKSILRRNAEKVNLQTWLEQLLETLKAEKKSQETKRKTFGAGSTALRIERPPTSQKAVIDQKKAELDAAQKTVQKLELQSEQFSASASRRAALEKIIASPIADAKPLEKERDDLKKKVDAYTSQTPKLESEVTKWRNQWEMFHVEHSRLKGELEAINAKIGEIDHLQKCKYCKSSRKGWKEEAKSELKVESLEISAKGLQVEASMGEVKEHGKNAKEALVTSQNADKSHQERLDRLSAVQSQLDQINAAKAKCETARAELKGLTQGAEQPSEEALELARQQVVNLREEIRTLETAEKAFTEWEANKAKQKQLEKDGLACHARIEIYKQAISIVGEEQKKVIAQAFDSILAPARRVTDGVLPGRLEYRNGSIGIASERGWTKYTTFSGNWRTIVFAALAVALAQQSPVKVAIIDELGTIDSDRKVALILRLVELTREGFIDNAILCDRTETVPSKLPSGVQVIKIS